MNHLCQTIVYAVALIWHSWQLVKNSRPIILDGTPASYRPIVQVVDNFARNHKLGLVIWIRRNSLKEEIDIGLLGFPE